MKRKKLLAFGLGIVMGLSPVSVFAAQQEENSDKMPETNVIMQAEEVLVEGEFAEEEVQEQVEVLEQEEGLNEGPDEDGVEEIEELEIELPEVNWETASGDVVINKTNFPDAVFRQYVLDKIDGDRDGRLSDVEIKNTESIYVGSIQERGKISSLKGIEYFTALKKLNCYRNQLSSLDVSRNDALEELDCSDNQLSSLDVSNNLALVTLSCGDNQLNSLDVSHNAALKGLYCGGSQLSSLDVSHNLALLYLYCGDNQLNSLDVSNNLALVTLSCGSNQLNSLDVSHNAALKGLFCSDNQLSSLDVSHNLALDVLDCANNQLSILDVSQNAALVWLWCFANQLSSLDVSHNLGLSTLSCYNNQLNSLDVSHNEALKMLFCSGNQLNSLDVSHNLALDTLECADNQLNSLDVSQNAALVWLWCSGNQLSSLDVSHNPNLYELSSEDNRIRIDGRQINMLLYDSKFDVKKVSNLQGLSLDGDVFTILDGEKSGTYNYDCGNNYIMIVAISKEPYYKDVAEIPGNWKYESVKYVSEKGIMGGVGGSNQFQPDNSLTRAMFATVLYRMAGEPSVEYSNKFSDVEAGKWYSNAIIWANQKGIVNGYTDGSYGIDNNITREQIAKMLYLYGKSQGYDVNGVSSLDSFTDKDEVSGWAVDYMKWAVNAQMISGKPNGNDTFRLDPKGQATRAECAKMLMMFMEKYK